MLDFLFTGDKAMDKEQEAILQEMDETRSSLSDKINFLEQTVVDTVHNASANVKETVEAVKEAVEGTVQSVKESVGETVDSVKHTFDIASQVERHPWGALAVAAGAGFAIGYVISPASNPRPQVSEPSRVGNGSFREQFASAPAAPSKEDGVIHKIAESFDTEITQLKELAIGTLASVIRDFVTTVMPDNLRDPVSGVLDKITTKLGGKPMEPGAFSMDRDEPSSSGQRDQYARGSANR